MYTFMYPDLMITEVLNSIKEVKEYVYKLHEEYHWLASSTWDWKDAKVLKNGMVIGLVSYNGRVWDINDEDNEIID